MASELGKMYVCDRCGKSIFVKYARLAYLEFPDGWASHDKEIGLLCPECEAKYQELLDDFFDVDKGDSKCTTD